MKKVIIQLLAVCLLISCSKETEAPEVIQSIAISETTLSLKVDETHKFTVTHTPPSLPSPKYAWYSSNVDVITVDNSGYITTLEVGEATISVKAEGTSLSAKCLVNVNPIEAQSLDISRTEVELLLGESIQLEVKISPENVTDKDISWSSSNTKIADVSDEGFVTSIGLGKAIISAELGAITVNCEVNVIPIPTDEVIISAEFLTLYIGTDSILTATVLPENTTDKTVTWKTNDNKVAKVSEYGVVSAVGIGETTISASSGSVTTTCEVKVIPIHVETPGTLSTLLADEQKFKLTNIAISGSLNEFDFLTIIEMSSLKILDISRIDNKTIPKRTFEENRVIEEVILPNGLVEIPDYLFYRSNISKCTIPSKVERIGIESFSRSRLTSVTIPPSVKVIDKEAFTFCELTEVQLSEGLAEIGDQAFYFCIELTEINFPSTITRIGRYAFNLCIRLAVDIVFPSDFKRIEDGAFSTCSKITGITLPEGLVYLGHAAFAECESLTGNLIIPSTVSFIGHSCFKGTGFNGDIVIPSSVTTIGSAAFIGIQYDKIFCKSVVPPKISKIVSSYGEANAFSKTKYLGIPKGSEEAYRNARYWEDFLVIEGVDFKD